MESSPRLPEEQTPAPPKPQRHHPDEEPILAASVSENLQSAPPAPSLASNNNHQATNGEPDKDTFQTSPVNTSTSPVRPTTLTSPAYSARPYPGRQESDSPRIISPQKASGGKLVRPKPQYPPGSPKRVMKDSTTGTESNHQPRVGRVKPNNRPISIVSPESSRVTTDPEPSPEGKIFLKSKSAVQGSPKIKPRPLTVVDGAGKAGPSNSKPKTPGGSPKSEADKGEKSEKSKKSSVWYEYGCV